MVYKPIDVYINDNTTDVNNSISIYNARLFS